MKRLIALILGISIVAVSDMNFSGCEKNDKSSVNTNEKMEKLKLYKGSSSSVNFDLYFDSSEGENKGKIAKEERRMRTKTILLRDGSNKRCCLKLVGVNWQSYFSALQPNDEKRVVLPEQADVLLHKGISPSL